MLLKKRVRRDQNSDESHYQTRDDDDNKSGDHSQ